MDEALMQVLNEGKTRLAERRVAQFAQVAAAQEQAARRQAETMSRFCDGLAGLIGKAGVNALAPFTFEQIVYGVVELRILVDEFPVVFEVRHEDGRGVRFAKDKPFIVAGIRYEDPVIDADGDLQGGFVDVTYVTRGYAQHPVEQLDDFGMALALAAERAYLVRGLMDMHAKREAELREELALAQPVPVYVAEEPGDCTDTLLNLTEWVRLIRDVVGEVLEERGLA